MPFYSSSSLAFSNPNLAQEAPEFASLYEAFNPLTTIAKTHFIEWFSGDDLDTIWTKVDGAGTGVFSMQDTIDEGFEIQTGALINNHSYINFNSIRHYAHDASILISISRITNLTSSVEQSGFQDTNSFGHFAIMQNDSAATPNFELNTKDGTTGSVQQGSVARDTSFHVKKLENTSTSNIMTIDGILDVTKTNNRPGVRLQPIVRAFTRTTAAKEVRVRYLEAYNT